jgi:hypothetical protein
MKIGNNVDEICRGPIWSTMIEFVLTDWDRSRKFSGTRSRCAELIRDFRHFYGDHDDDNNCYNDDDDDYGDDVDDDSLKRKG